MLNRYLLNECIKIEWSQLNYPQGEWEISKFMDYPIFLAHLHPPLSKGDGEEIKVSFS